MKYKAVIFDLDGTAMESAPNALPSDRLVAAIQRYRGRLAVACATGRNWPFGKNAIQKLQLWTPCIVSAGTQIVDPISGKVLWQETIGHNETKAVFRVLSNEPYHMDLNDDLPKEGMHVSDITINRPLYLINIKTVPSLQADILVSQIQQVPNITCTKAISQTPGYFDLHITNKRATKEHAVKTLCTMLNLRKEEVVGVGDAHNDIHLFEAVGLRVAMGNAVPELKDAADLIIKPVSEDGLAVLFENLDQVGQ